MFDLVFQDNFTPELYYLCLSFGIFSVLSSGKFSFPNQILGRGEILLT